MTAKIALGISVLTLVLSLWNTAKIEAVATTSQELFGGVIEILEIHNNLLTGME